MGRIAEGRLADSWRRYLRERRCKSEKRLLFGRVVDRYDKPIMRAIVGMAPGSSERISNKWGEFEFVYGINGEGERQPLRLGHDYTISAWKPGYHETTQIVRFEGGPQEVPTITLVEDIIQLRFDSSDLEALKHVFKSTVGKSAIQGLFPEGQSTEYAAYLETLWRLASEGNLSTEVRSTIDAVLEMGQDICSLVTLIHVDSQTSNVPIPLDHSLRHLLAQDPAIATNPILLIEQARVCLNARDWRCSKDMIETAELFLELVPPAFLTSRRARSYEIKALALEGMTSNSEDIGDLMDSLTVWKEYLSWAGNRESPETIRLIENRIERLNRILERMQ